MENKHKLTIIILTWNGLAFTKKCLASIRNCFLPSSTEIICVDNNSTDCTIDFLKKQKDITLIQNSKNLGYSKAVNIGIKAASKESDILLLNNDTEIVDENAFIKLQNTAYSQDDIGIVGCKILINNSDIIQHCGAFMPLDTLWGQQIGSNEINIGQYSGIWKCESVVFACVYIKRAVLDKVGLLNEKFFAYFEDSDYCIRVQKLGYSIVVDGNTVIKHAENTSTKVNRVSHSKLFTKSQSIFKEEWGKYLKETKYTQNLDWHSIINFPSGYARSSRAIIEELDRQNVKVGYQYVYGPGTVFPVEEPQHSDSYMANIVKNRGLLKAEKQVVYGQGDIFEKNSGKYKIGFTMLEVTGLPDEWVRQANMMNEVWVPSSFNQRVFKNAGVKVPIHIIPLGYDPAYFSSNIRAEKDNSVFTFLSAFEWGERKGPDVLLKAFSDEFSKDESVRLIVKANNFDPSVSIKREVEDLKLRKNGGRIFIAENQIFQSYEMGILYRSCDCFVLSTRGEGWGMPILEAMACGLPVIATNWSAQADFLCEDYTYPLEVEKLIPAVAKCPYYKGFEWAQPSYEHLRYLMRYVYENQKLAQEKGLKAEKAVKELWTWKHTAEKIKERLGS